MRTVLGTFTTVMLFAACSAPVPQSVANTAAADATAHQAHEAYVTAINSNNLDSLLGMLTAAELYVRTIGAQHVRCAKLQHPIGGPCIFRCRYVVHRENPA